MMEPAEAIIELLRKSNGNDFEKAVCKTFRFLGFDSKWVGSEEGEVDVIADSVRLKIPCKIVCECCAAYDGSEVGNDKVGQVRSNGPKHRTPNETLYLIVVGRPKFSDVALENAKPDVCLILAEDLVQLVENHAYYHFGNEDLEKIFVTIGVTSKIVQDLIFSHRRKLERKLSVYALTCITIEKLAKEVADSSMRIRKDALVHTTRAYGEALGIGIFSLEEIIEGLAVLDSPMVNIVSVETDDVIVRGVALEQALPRLDPLKQVLVEKFSKWKKQLSLALEDAESQV